MVKYSYHLHIHPYEMSIDDVTMPTRIILKAVIAGDIEKTAYLLGTFRARVYVFDFGPWEPYVTLSTPNQLAALKLVLDEPLFKFDVTWLLSCCYFTQQSIYDLIIYHPRAAKWLRDPEKIKEDYAKEFPNRSSMYTSTGHLERLLNAMCRVRQTRRRRQQWAIVFLAYPALKIWIRRCLEEIYAPGGKLFLEAKSRFNAGRAALITA